MSIATLPASLRATPRLDRWLSVSAEGHVVLSPGKVEIGQGILTALVQVCADELDIAPERVRLVPAGTAVSPNEGVTSGSLSVSDCGQSVRLVSAQARGLFLAEAARQFSVPAEALHVDDGVIAGPGNLATSYWELAGSVSLACEADPAIARKSPEQRRLAGQSMPRIDIPGKVFAQRPFIHDLVLPGMLHGRVLRPPRPGAVLDGLDEARLAGLPGLRRIVRDGSFLGVVCTTEAQAEAALARLAAAAHWAGGFKLPDPHDLPNWLKAQPAEASVVDVRGGDAPPAARTITRHYEKQFLAHASIAPSCAIAHWSGESLQVLTHSQGVFNLRADLALVFGLQAETIKVTHAEGAGCYGHNGADDVALDAALLARAIDGHPVRVRWSRADELSCSPVGAGMAIELSADLDEAGDIADWRHTIWSNGYVGRPGRAASPALLASFDLQQPFPRYIALDPPLAGGGGAQRNAVPLYDFPRWTIAKNRVTEMPLRTSSMRALGAFGNVFAIESFVDELALETGEDAVAFRLRHLSEPRARAVLKRAAAMADWGRATIPEGRGRGLAMARYKNTGAWCAVVAEVDLEDEPRATRLWIAVDVGEAINPDGVINQIEGGAIQAVSWTLKEEVAFTREAVISASWETYPILRFSEVPAVSVEIMPGAERPPLGAGEAAQGPTAAALANAVHNALGVRVRRMPITRERIISAME